MLSDLYMMFTMKVDSLDFGMVGARKRSYGVMLLRTDVLARFASLDNVIPMFYRVRGVGFGSLDFLSVCKSKAKLENLKIS